MDPRVSAKIDAIFQDGIAEGRKLERERCARIAEFFSNAEPGDICEVMAGDFQKEIADAIRREE